MLEKSYRAAEVEARLYPVWEASGAFAARGDGRAAPWCVMMPPPNVTGSLHMGHALNMTLQDVLTRFYRRRGRDALWQPGMDHAGIATQMVVERQLAEAGKTRHDLGRERFIERVWQWKAQSGGAITRQLRRLGATPDWARERFTMDEGLNHAVRRVFVRLYKDGLIYRDKRLVNWDPKLHTAISDLEVEQREVKGRLWHLRYPLADAPERFIVVATTRPETMLGDTAVAVHPDDERYRDLVGRDVLLPIVGRRIPIVADDYADPAQGSGAVKITPAHDFNDFEVGKRHHLPLINVFDQHACVTDDIFVASRWREDHPDRAELERDPEIGPIIAQHRALLRGLVGLDRFAARQRVVEEVERLGLLETVEPHVHAVPHGDRSGVPIEPWLTEQWYCDAKTLAQPAIKAVEEGRTVFVPRQWENTYFEWMRNIQPWCISRQLWWGHQIPAWYGPDDTVFVEETEDEARQAARQHFGHDVALERDGDVLDTWFSSALWPFSTLSWPDETPELARYYPGDVLITGFDIIFFWVARMMMMGLHFMGDVPFRTVYIHALVRDERGQKMSKSKGNIIDPLELIDAYGADSLRFTLISMAAQGRDIKLSAQRVEGYRNFATKLWNAARYCQLNECVEDPAFRPEACRLTANRWIVGELAKTARRVDDALLGYRFNEAANALYQFTWYTFCDWYLEFTKPILGAGDPDAADETRAATWWTLCQIVHLLNPLMPFLTEELWRHLAPAESADGSLLLTAAWPAFDEGLADEAAAAEMNGVVTLISSVRAVRAEMNVPPGAEIPLLLKDAGPAAAARLRTHGPLIARLARISSMDLINGEVPKGAAQTVLEDATLILPLAGIIDLDRERARLSKEIARIDGEIAKIDGKLTNAQFLAKAPEDVVDEQRDRRGDLVGRREKLEAALARVAAD